MTMCISRFVILAIAISAILVATSTMSAVAFQQGDMNSYKSGDITGSDKMGESANQEGVTPLGTATPEVPSQDQCYASCSTGDSRIMRTLCALGCGYVTEPVPMIP